MRSPVEKFASFLCLLTACTVSSTGNPGHDNGDAPRGIEFVSSNLPRDLNPQVSPDDGARLAAGNRSFALALYSQLVAGSTNLLFSPVSISTSLAMLYAGAEGESEAEMRAALRISLPEPALHSTYNAAQLELLARAKQLVTPESSGDGFDLQLTTGAFAQQDKTFVPGYLDLLGIHYGAGVFRADFSRDPEGERVAINDWVLEQTRQRIPDLLPPGSLNANVPLVLVDAVYFKASWMRKFDASLTRPAPFVAPRGMVTVQMMHGSGHDYMRGEGYAALELPYISDSIRVLFILPDASEFEKVEARFDDALFQSTRKALSRHEVAVGLPKFRFQSAHKLASGLRALGMEQAFQPGVADLSGIAGRPGELYVEEIYHKTFIAVDEQGTEAAAATAVVKSAVSALPAADFTVDRPFIFLIHDVPTGQIIFLGRVLDPTQ